MSAEINSINFQTPLNVAKYMCSLIPRTTITVMEPSAGSGNMLSFLTKYLVTTPYDFFQLDRSLRFDCIVMNPPFSLKYAYGVPENFEHKGMRLGYYFLTECMKMSDNIIALMPWFTISDSDVRLRYLKSFGLKSITALPRKTFQYARIQTCVFELKKGYQFETKFKVFDFINNTHETK
jgi:type I restriction-modification system DNA methylase subunit